MSHLCNLMCADWQAGLAAESFYYSYFKAYVSIEW